LAELLSHARMRPLWIGGLFYSVGAVLNRLHWPVLVPGAFEAHEVFHLFVMAGSAWHFYFMLSAVLPYQPMPALVPVLEADLALPSEQALVG
jgi:hemolysin III